jgi:hypothetical protein
MTSHVGLISKAGNVLFALLLGWHEVESIATEDFFGANGSIDFYQTLWSIPPLQTEAIALFSGILPICL